MLKYPLIFLVFVSLHSIASAQDFYRKFKCPRPYGLYPYSKQPCSKFYYKCNAGSSQLETCPEPMVFVRKEARCEIVLACLPTTVEPTVTEEQLITTIAPNEEQTEEPISEVPTQEQTKEPSGELTEEPNQELTEEPGKEETEEPNQEETEEPSDEQTEEPSEEQTEEPSEEQTEEPSGELTEEPNQEQTGEPGEEETDEPISEESNEEQTEEAITGPSDQPFEEESSTLAVTQNQEFPDELSTAEVALSTAKPMQPIVCPPSNGIVANPNDCHSFYICANGSPYRFVCPANLVFNSALHICDWPYNVSTC